MRCLYPFPSVYTFRESCTVLCVCVCTWIYICLCDFMFNICYNRKFNMTNSPFINWGISPGKVCILRVYGNSN